MKKIEVYGKKEKVEAAEISDIEKILQKEIKEEKEYLEMMAKL